MTHGGSRAGAGRKPGKKLPHTIKREIAESEARAVLVNSLLKDWEPIIDIVKQVGMGTYVVPEGRHFPDTKLLLELASFVIGKPKQEVSGTVNLPEIQKLTDVMQNVLDKK